MVRARRGGCGDEWAARRKLALAMAMAEAGTVLGGAVLLRKAKEEAREMKIVSAGRERASAG